MDVLKELFGTQDELHIAKSLFGNQDSQESVQIGHSNSHDNNPNDLALLVSSSQQTLTSQVLAGNKTAHVLDRSGSPKIQSVFSQLSVSPQARRRSHGSAEDIRCVPAEMPMYLLEEDEGNDEEIIRLLNIPFEKELSQDNLLKHLYAQSSLTVPPVSVSDTVVTKQIQSTLTVPAVSDTVVSGHTQSSLTVLSQSDSIGILSPQYRLTGCQQTTCNSINCDKIHCKEHLSFNSLTNSSKMSTVSVTFPWVSNTSSIGLTVTPVKVLPSVQSAVSVHPRKKCRHGGGWPKGKSRKPETLHFPPKPANTGYGIFLSEYMAREKAKHTSMSQVSKELGKLWSGLSSKEKKVYYERADGERERYVTELRHYLSNSANSNLCLQEVDEFLSQVSATERDDCVLVCDVCNISFTSVHNKRCHFSGKLHMQALLKDIKEKQNNLSERNIESETGSSPSLSSTFISHICQETEKFSSCIDELRSLDSNYNVVLDKFATLQQACNEQEAVYQRWFSVLCTLKDIHSHLVSKIHHLIDFPQCKDSLETLHSDI